MIFVFKETAIFKIPDEYEDAMIFEKNDREGKWTKYETTTNIIFTKENIDEIVYCERGCEYKDGDQCTRFNKPLESMRSVCSYGPPQKIKSYCIGIERGPK